jgi:hypothetical protein
LYAHQHFNTHISVRFVSTQSLKLGLCCSFGEGGPVELFYGTPDKGYLLFSDPYEGKGRIVSEFSLGSSAGATSSGGSWVSYSFYYGVMILASVFFLAS